MDLRGAVAGSGPATQSCSSTPQIWPTGLFTNGQIGGGSDDGASVATVAGTDVPPTTECICSAEETCRDPAAGSTDGVGIQSWYFLPRACLPATLP